MWNWNWAPWLASWSPNRYSARRRLRPKAQAAAIRSAATARPICRPPNPFAPAVAAEAKLSCSALIAWPRSCSRRLKPAAELSGPVPITSWVSAA